MADRPIVVAADGSDASLIALRRGLELAKRLGTDAHVVAVTHLSPIFQVGMGAAMPPSVLGTDVQAELTAHMWHQIDPVLGEDPDLEITKVNLRGYPADCIVAYAEDVDAELVVVGNRGYGPFRSAMLGSTSHRIAQFCNQDVLVVRTDEA